MNVSSFASKVVPTHETLYAAAKCAMNGFSEGLWNDLRGSDIHVALVHPGPIDTEIWDKGDQPNRYTGRKYPPSSSRTRSSTRSTAASTSSSCPRRNPSLVVARFLRLVAPAPAPRGHGAHGSPSPRQSSRRPARRPARGGASGAEQRQRAAA